MVAELKPTPEQHVKWTTLQDPVTGATLEVALVYVTVELALAWLARNVNFRKKRPGLVLRYTDLMLRALWELNGETIKFYGNGDLKDGQHRLEACVESGKSFVSLVVRGIQSDIHIDTGPGRTLGELLVSRGEERGRDLAATLRVLYRWEHGKLTDSGFYRDTTDYIALLDRHPDVRQSVVLIGNHKTRLLPPALIAFFHYAFSRTDKENADAFFRAFDTGANLSETNPVYILRDVLEKNQKQKRRFTTKYKMALTIKAWHFWLKGEPIKRASIRWAEFGKNAQPFPSIGNPEETTGEEDE